MDRNGKNLIVTETPTIEIDGRLFQDIFAAETYLVRKGMSVSGARCRVRELVNIALNRPTDEGRRNFLKTAFSTTTVIMYQGLGGQIADNWAKHFWDSLSSSYKNKARRQYLNVFLPYPVSRSKSARNFDFSLLKIFTESSHCDISILDGMIVRDLPQARLSVHAFREFLTGFSHAKLDPYEDKDVLGFLGELGLQNLHRSSVSKITHDILRDHIAKFYDIVDANPLLRHTFDSRRIELVNILGDGTEEVVSQEVSSFTYFTRQLHDSWGASQELRDSNEALQMLTSMRNRVADFLKKYSKQNHPRFNFEYLAQIERAQALREIQSDPNWYHAREAITEPLVRKDVQGSHSDTVISSFQRFYTPETWLDAFDGMIKIAQLFELK